MWAAHAVPLLTLPSGLWRAAMAVGTPVGYTDSVLREDFGIPGPGVAYVLGLAVATECLALLTLGLVRPWGERLPYWLPYCGGRAIRPMAVVFPAALGAAALTGLTVLFTGQLLAGVEDDGRLGDTAGTVLELCYLPLFLWGPLLGAVTVSYCLRRRRTTNPAHGRSR